MSSDYVCTLTPESQAKAKKELNEDPKERQGAVQALREWILQQPHLTCSTETSFLLRFLRVSKFSQLSARERVERYVMVLQEHPKYIRNIDTREPKLQLFYDSLYFIPLGYNKNGEYCFMFRPGLIDVDQKVYDKTTYLRGVCSTWLQILGDENACVNGLQYFGDLTGFGLRHQMYFNLDDLKLFSNLIQKALPSRFKGMHFYNMNPFFEVTLQMFTPLLSKKFKDRIHLCGSNMEKLYKTFPKEILPVEFLPDDYTGPNAGTIKEISDKMKAEIQLSQNRDRILFETGSAFSYEKSKKDKDTVQASFRKLAVD